MGNRILGIDIQRKDNSLQEDRFIQISVTTSYGKEAKWIELPLLGIEDLKVLRKEIRKTIKKYKQ